MHVFNNLYVFSSTLLMTTFFAKQCYQVRLLLICFSGFPLCFHFCLHFTLQLKVSDLTVEQTHTKASSANAKDETNLFLKLPQAKFQTLHIWKLLTRVNYFLKKNHTSVIRLIINQVSEKSVDRFEWYVGESSPTQLRMWMIHSASSLCILFSYIHSFLSLHTVFINAWGAMQITPQGIKILACKFNVRGNSSVIKMEMVHRKG